MELSGSEEQLKEHLGIFFDSLKVGDVVLLSADLGMGKTTLVRNFVEYKYAQAQEQKVSLKAVQFSSPSYNLIQEYKLGAYKIYHIDLYRLEDEDQVQSVGLWDVLADENSITFIEWSERINTDDLPQRTTYEIKITDPNSTLPNGSLSEQRQYEVKRLL